MRAPAYSQVADELLTQEAIDNPHILYRRLRENQPLSRVADSGVHLAASWDLIDEVLQREQDFSANLTGVLYRDADGAPACFELPATGASYVIATADDPAHAVHRSLLQASFTPKRLTALEAPISDWTRAAMAPLLAAGGGDFAPVAERVPALVVAALLGLPMTDVEHFKVWAMLGGAMLAGEVSGERLSYLAEETARMAAYLGKYFDQAFDATQPEAGAPLLHALARGVHRGEIDRDAAIGIAIVLFGAGGESTAALIASALRLLAEQPELADQLRDDPALLPRFIEEVVRLEPPFKFHYRAVQRSCELAGYDLDRGDRLMLLWAAANRDSSVIEAADTVRLDRKHPKQHMGFGRGLHFCIGAVLARLEARIILEQLLLATRHIALKPGTALYANSIFVRRLERLELELSKQAN